CPPPPPGCMPPPPPNGHLPPLPPPDGGMLPPLPPPDGGRLPPPPPPDGKPPPLDGKQPPPRPPPPPGRRPPPPPPPPRPPPAPTEGPFFVDEMLNRTDLTSGTSEPFVTGGAPFQLAIGVYRVAGATCTPLEGAQVDVWHASAEGVYSDEPSGMIQNKNTVG